MNDDMSTSNIARLKMLVEELGDRDTQMRQDHDLFEDFFENFPLPVTIWSVTSDGIVISQRGNDFVCKNAKCLNEMFECPVIKQASLEKHKQAFCGEKVDYIIEIEEKTYYAKLVPSLNDKDQVVGVTGIAWNVTSNAMILRCIEKIAELTTNRRGGYKEIFDLANVALLNSSLKKLINAQEDTSE